MAVSKRLRFEILRRDNHACRYCGATAPDARLTIDHVIPVALGGTDEPANLATACSGCNSGKSATPADAAVVDDVAADALRWSAAIATAAETMLAARDKQRALLDEFLVYWNDWTYKDWRTGERRPFDLPPGWEVSVGNILAAGLPADVLGDCVSIAMSAKYAKDEFRYMCGVAWNRVAAMREIAATVIEAQDGE